VQDNCTLHVTRDTGPLVLEEEVTLGHNAVVHACTIRRGALIGMNATVLDDADVGRSALVAAGAVVLPGTVIPPATLWAGSPAKKKRDLTPDEVVGLETYWKNYLVYKAEYLKP
jgi:carbonic anhydrase/acetyltransferase-like protein (isoleucine patch superfamily)